MTKFQLSLRLMSAAIATFGIGAAGLAQKTDTPSPKAGTLKQDASSVEAREQNTNRLLLKGLLERRAELARSTDGADKRAALDWLDQRIADIKGRLGK